MKISTRGRYALRMMLDLAQHQGEGVTALKDIAARQDISKKYLEQIIPKLHQAGLLLAARSDYIEVNGYRYPRTPVALTEQPVSDGGGYHALWGASERGEKRGKAAAMGEASVAQSMQAG